MSSLRHSNMLFDNQASETVLRSVSGDTAARLPWAEWERLKDFAMLGSMRADARGSSTRLASWVSTVREPCIGLGSPSKPRVALLGGQPSGRAVAPRDVLKPQLTIRCRDQTDMAPTGAARVG